MGRIAGVAALLTLVGVGLWVWVRGRPEPVPALVAPPLPAQVFAAYRADLERLPPAPLDDDAALLEAFRGLNRTEAAQYAKEHAAGQVSTPREPTPEALQAQQAWQSAAWNYVQNRGGARFVQVGRHQGLLFADRLVAFLADCTARGVTPTQALATPDAPAAVAELVEVGGLFPLFLGVPGQPGSFLGADGQLIPAYRPFLQAIFLEQWVRSVRARLAVDSHLTSDERAWLLRWKVELQVAAPVDARVAAAEGLRGLEGYPTDLNAGVLLYQAGRFGEAAARFARAPEPQAEAWRHLAERAAK